ncbi:MAG: hypothetical protein R3D26_01185 [Cyanobacteriota/Melainabacteria group bacterium]
MKGLPLDQYLNKVVGDYSKLDSLQSQFRLLIKRMYDRRIAHGDLQHGNILIEDDRMVLVDYDGMYVPSPVGLRECRTRSSQLSASKKKQFSIQW